MNFSHFKNNLYGGLTASIVALPLALAFGVASGAGAISGVYGAIVLGFFAAIFGGTPTQISGPTGPMTVVMAGIISYFISQYPEHGLALAFTTVMLGGLVQIALGLFKVGRFINFIPYTVVSGFMNGIGIIIILLQLMPFLGISHNQHSPLDVLLQLPHELAHLNPTATLLSSLLLAILIFWPSRWDRILPAPLFVLIAGTMASYYLFDSTVFNRIGEVPSGSITWYFPFFKADMFADMIKYALVLGALGTIDSLLTSLVADNMTQTEHHSDKELIGQGIGNFLSGIFGGLPGAGATMRTVVNIRSGGTSPLSGVIHALGLIIIVGFAGNLIAKVPMVVLAAILVKVGLDIIDWAFLKRLYRAPLSNIAIVSVVFFLTVFVDLITAVGAGVVLASFLTLNRLTNDQLENANPKIGQQLLDELSPQDQVLVKNLKDELLIYSLSGPFTFGAAKGISRKLTGFSQHKVLLIDLANVSSMDTTTALAIEDIVKNNRNANRYVVVVCNQKIATLLDKVGVANLIGQHKIFNERSDALKKAKELID